MCRSAETAAASKTGDGMGGSVGLALGLGPALAAIRVRLGLVALLLVIAVTAWWSTIDPMRGMDEGFGTNPGALGWFLGVWVVMMAAMMFPSVAPTVALYSRMTKSRSPVAPLLFASGYLVAWTSVGVFAFAVATAGGRISGDLLAWDRAGRWIAGAEVEIAQPALPPARTPLHGEHDEIERARLFHLEPGRAASARGV